MCLCEGIYGEEGHLGQRPKSGGPTLNGGKQGSIDWMPGLNGLAERKISWHIQCPFPKGAFPIPHLFPVAVWFFIP